VNVFYGENGSHFSGPIFLFKIKKATKFVNKKGLEKIGFKPGEKDLLAKVKNQIVFGTVSPIFKHI
jgi:hypothetical protein